MFPRAGTRPPTGSSPTSRACELCRARSAARAVLTSIPQAGPHNCLVAIMLVHRPVPRALPQARRHPGGRPAADRNVRLGPLPAGHPPPEPPRRSGPSTPSGQRPSSASSAQTRTTERTRLRGRLRPGPAASSPRSTPPHRPPRRTPHEDHRSPAAPRTRTASGPPWTGSCAARSRPAANCDIKTLAREAGRRPHRLLRHPPLRALREEFETRLAAIRQDGDTPDPREAQISRLKAEIATLKERLTRQDATIAGLTGFKASALSRLAAQHDEITRLRASRPERRRHPPATRRSPLTPLNARPRPSLGAGQLKPARPTPTNRSLPCPASRSPDAARRSAHRRPRPRRPHHRRGRRRRDPHTILLLHQGDGDDFSPYRWDLPAATARPSPRPARRRHPARRHRHRRLRRGRDHRLPRPPRRHRRRHAGAPSGSP